MKRPAPLHPSVLIALLLASASAAAQVPQRRAGLWSMAAEHGTLPMRQCIGPGMDDLATRRAPDTANHRCTTPTVKRESAQRMVVSTRCEHDGSTVDTRMVFTGDFETAIDAEINIHREPARTGGSDQTMHASYRWEGPCPAGVTPGQMVLPNGQVIDPAAMARRR